MNLCLGRPNFGLFSLKIVLNIMSTIGFTIKLNALNFEKDNQILLVKASAHIRIAWASTAHVCQYVI